MNDFTPIKYIGVRDTYRDGCYNSGGEWVKGQTVMIQSDKAKLLLKHPDVYELGVSEDSDGIESDPPEHKDDEDPLQATRDFINSIPRKDTLRQYARDNFRMDLPEGKLYEMKASVISLIDKFGIE